VDSGRPARRAHRAVRTEEAACRNRERLRHAITAPKATESTTNTKEIRKAGDVGDIAEPPATT